MARNPDNVNVTATLHKTDVAWLDKKAKKQLHNNRSLIIRDVIRDAREAERTKKEEA